jgi:hypothetical protein
MPQQLDLFLTEDDYLPVGNLKLCNACGKHLPVTNFPVYQPKINKAWSEGLRRASCSKCWKEGEHVCSVWRKRNPLPVDFRCPICTMSHADFRATGRYLNRTPFSVDHCHKTMTVRGYVCNPCNSSMGFIKDDVSSVRRMLDFLIKSSVHNGYDT